MQVMMLVCALKKARKKCYRVYQANPRKRTGDVINHLGLWQVLKILLFKQHSVYIEIYGYERR